MSSALGVLAAVINSGEKAIGDAHVGRAEVEMAAASRLLGAPGYRRQAGPVAASTGQLKLEITPLSVHRAHSASSTHKCFAQ